MPPSKGQDVLNSSSVPLEPGNPNHKGSSTGVAIPTQNGKKNGKTKDNGGGGVLAAVTKHASKNTAKASALPPRLQSPDLKSTILDDTPITSPPYEATNPASLAPSNLQNTTEWTRNVPVFSGSPSNLINLGESPPIKPSSHEEKLASYGWNTREQRGIRSSHPLSASPPVNRRRPMSYHIDGHTPPGADDYHSQISSYTQRDRRSSMHSRYSQTPLPHQAQAHFFGAPDVNLMLSPPIPGMVAGEHGYYCGFDTLVSPAGDPQNAFRDNILITGYEGGLDVFSVSKRVPTKIARLEGLRGGVWNAKILSCNKQEVLIGVVVHGPVWTTSDASSGDFETPFSDETSQKGALGGSPGVRAISNQGNDSPVEYYQTTVEVYSLYTKKHITTLLSVPKIHLPVPTSSIHFKPPSPSGSLSIRSDSDNIVITSGSTGETWLFRHTSEDSTHLNSFRCIGKVWTTIQHSLTADPNGLNGLPDGDWHSEKPAAARSAPKASILSLNGRLLAYCPAAASSQVSLRAAVHGLNSTSKVPGLNSQAPPQLPQVNCGVDVPEGESMIKQVAQMATQELVKGAAYIGKYGAQTWNNYWNKPTPSQHSNGNVQQPYPSMASQFPPTHGVTNHSSQVTKEPGLVSIIDLNSLIKQTPAAASPHTLATFKITHGCSFLSFAPSGLALFTASSKGDTQFVWDLMRMQYAKSSYLKTSSPGSGPSGPHVRQIAQFSRMTVARVVDVVWSAPSGERAAMVTERGTVHILDLPVSAFTWPAPRRIAASSSSVDESNTSPAMSAAGVATNAIHTLWSTARPMVRGKRRSSTGMPAITAAGVTQASAASISKSFNVATGKMNEMRNSSVKLHLPRNAATPSRNCVQLVTGRRDDFVLVVGDGLVGVYTIKGRKGNRSVSKQSASRGARYVESRIPPLPNYEFSPETVRDFNQTEDLDLTAGGVLTSAVRRKQPTGNQSREIESSIPEAEIESNAPYQPFHTDRRVTLQIYSDQQDAIQSPSVSVLFSAPRRPVEKASNTGDKPKQPWAFGREIKTLKLEVGPPRDSEDSFYVPSENHRALPSSAIERMMHVTKDSEDSDHIVVTTRIRKNARSGTGSGLVDEEGFFEDDCDVLDFASQRV